MLYVLNFAGPPALTTVNVMKNIENSSIIVQWDEMDDSLTTTYIVTWTSEGDHITHHVTLIEQLSHTITGLTLDTVYTVTVAAANRCDQGPEYRTSVSLTTDPSLSPTPYPSPIPSSAPSLTPTATATATNTIVTTAAPSTTSIIVSPTPTVNISKSYLILVILDM